jgi:hypothetical protein
MFMIEHQVSAQQAKEVVLYHNPNERDSLEASIDKNINSSKEIKDNSPGIGQGKNTNESSKQVELVA